LSAVAAKNKFRYVNPNMQQIDELFIWQQYQQMLKVCDEKIIASDLKSRDWRVKAAANLAMGDLIASSCKAPEKEYIELLIENLFDNTATDKKSICVQCARRSLIIASAKRMCPNRALTPKDLMEYSLDFGPVVTSSSDGESADKDNKVAAERWDRYFSTEIKPFKKPEVKPAAKKK
jgi:hypothetical protein